MSDPKEYTAVEGQQRVIDAESLEADRIGNAAYRATPSDNLQTVINNAGSDSIVYVEPGTYNSVDLNSAQLLIGLTADIGENTSNGVIIDGGTTDHAVDMSADYCAAKGIKGSTTSGGGTNHNSFNVDDTSKGVNIIQCGVPESGNVGIFVDGEECIVSQCRTRIGFIDGNPVEFGSNSIRSIADSLVDSTVVDNGSSNIVGDIS